MKKETIINYLIDSKILTLKELNFSNIIMSNNENQSNNKDKKEIDSLISGGLKVLKLLKNRTLLQLVILLLIFPNLSLSKLSKLSKKSKGTVTHQLSKLEQLGVIITSRKHSRGSIDAKVYELAPNFLEFKSYSFQGLKNFKESDNPKLFNESILNDILIFEVLKKIFDQAIQIYQEIEEFMEKSESLISFDPKNLKSEDLVNYDALFLTEDEFKIYKEISTDFKLKMKKLLEKNQNNKNKTTKPYFLLNVSIPLLDFYEKDIEKKFFKKFFKALD